MVLQYADIHNFKPSYHHKERSSQLYVLEKRQKQPKGIW